MIKTKNFVQKALKSIKIQIILDFAECGLSCPTGRKGWGKNCIVHQFPLHDFLLTGFLLEVFSQTA